MKEIFWKLIEIWAIILGTVVQYIGVLLTVIGVGLTFSGYYLTGKVANWEEFNKIIDSNL